MHAKLTAILLFPVLLLTACSSGNEYSSEVKNGFLRNCSASGRSSPLFCQCALEQLQREYNEQDFLAQEAEAKVNQRFSDRMQQSFVRIHQSCKQS